MEKRNNRYGVLHHYPMMLNIFEYREAMGAHANDD
jgi:hypothetical protein